MAGKRAMMQALLSGFVLSLGLIVAIGAQNAFVLRQGLRREHVGAVVAFCAAADFALMGAGIAGLGAAIGAAPGLAALMAAGGAAFLLWQGLAAWARAARPARLVAAGGGAVTLGAALGQVAGFTFLNPHVWLDTVLLVGSVGAAQPEGARGAFLLGAGAASLMWFASLGYGARLLAPLFARPLAWRVLDGAIGAVMIALAAGLALHALRAA
jgi:L-lysine exporter family protein LysE/ArgO